LRGSGAFPTPGQRGVTIRTRSRSIAGFDGHPTGNTQEIEGIPIAIAPGEFGSTPRCRERYIRVNEPRHAQYVLRAHECHIFLVLRGIAGPPLCLLETGRLMSGEYTARCSHRSQKASDHGSQPAATMALDTCRPPLPNPRRNFAPAVFVAGVRTTDISPSPLVSQHRKNPNN
jgi:hypothetical protein